MVVVAQDIKATGGDHATIASWIAAVGNSTDYNAGDDADGKMFDEAYNEDDNTIVAGSPESLNSITLRAASGEEHDGTAGTGARIATTSNSTDLLEQNSSDLPVDIIGLEFTSTGQAFAAFFQATRNSAEIATIRRCIFYKGGSGGVSSGAVIRLNGSGATLHALNNFVFDVQEEGGTTYDVHGMSMVSGTTRATKFLNNTVHKITHDGSGDCFGIFTGDDSSVDVKNCICTDNGGTTSGSKGDFAESAPSNADYVTNLSSDTTAVGTDLDSKTSANQFVSNSSPFNLHLVTGADAKDAGTDLGTTPTDVQFDIDNEDRDTLGDTWDVGADEFVAAGGLSIPVANYHYANQGLA